MTERYNEGIDIPSGVTEAVNTADHPERVGRGRCDHEDSELVGSSLRVCPDCGLNWTAR